MNIELLAFGNVTVFALALALAVAGLVLLNQIVLWVGRIALSLDAEGAPKVLESNWLLGKVKEPLLTHRCLLKRGNCYLDERGIIHHSERYAHIFDKSGLAYKLHRGESDSEVAAPDEVSLNLVGKVFVFGVITDLAILWLQHHFLSAVWVLSVAGIVLALRFITGKLWGHNKRITTLEEK